MKRNLGNKREITKQRLLRKAEVVARTGYSAVQLWRLERQGLFPRRFRLGEQAVAWVESEIDEWIRSRVRQGGKRPPVQYRGGLTKPKADGCDPQAAPQCQRD